MDWQQKLEALQALGDCALRMRSPDDWYVSQNSTELKMHADDYCLGGKYGNGHSPEEAVEDHWRVLVDDLPPEAMIIIHAMSRERRRQVRWSGYMWKDVP